MLIFLDSIVIRKTLLLKLKNELGLLNGIEFAPPTKLAVRALYETFRRIHPAMFGQVMVMRMFREKGFLTQICGNNFMVLKAAPPLTVDAKYFGYVSDYGGSHRRAFFAASSSDDESASARADSSAEA